MLLIKGGNVVNSDGSHYVDVRVKDDKIVEIGHDLQHRDEKVIDAVGLHVLPGAIDPHVHFRDPGHPEKEDFESGSMAALAGGVTTVFDMPNTNPPTIDMDALRQKREAAKKAKCNVRFFVGATEDNIGNLAELCAEPDVVGVKIYMGSSTGSLLVDNVSAWEEIFEIPDIQVVVHAECEECIQSNLKKFESLEDPQMHSVVRGNDVAETATRQALEIGFKHNTRLHIAHMSTREELFAVREYKKKGYENLSCEVCTHHLIFNLDDYDVKGMFIKVNPPIRSREDRNALWEDGIALGVVDMLASDHAPHTIEQKSMDYEHAPSGMPGVQECTSLMLNQVNDDELDFQRFLELRCFNPARVFELKKRGDIKEGYFADFVLVDINEEHTFTKDVLKSRCGWSNYEGRKVKGWVKKTIVNGDLVFSD